MRAGEPMKPVQIIVSKESLANTIIFEQSIEETMMCESQLRNPIQKISIKKTVGSQLKAKHIPIPR